MNFNNKFGSISEALSLRIKRGDYKLMPLPTEEALAREFSVSRMTARRAILELLDKKMLFREPGGRLRLADAKDSATRGSVRDFSVALLTPSFHSPLFNFWRESVERVCSAAKVTVTPIFYSHWHDPALLRSLVAFDGVFLVPETTAAPDSLLKRLATGKPPVAIMSTNAERWDIPSIDTVPTNGAALVLDHLFKHGHRNIMCLNCQNKNAEIDARIQAWRDWCGARHCTGELIDQPAKPYSDPYEHAHAAMAKYLSRGPIQATAIYCTTAPGAAGAVRALLDSGLKAGKDIAVCAHNDEGWARLFCPSITCLKLPRMDAEIARIVQWMKSGAAWSGPTHISPAGAKLFEGESSRDIWL